ncbi:serine hydrolase [Clostridium autoethanogenum]|uniref:Beta-lactamase n=2 Tax=Clostridium TaxID=1485 RepID=D8GU44_CLOLD|nr:MULTISPECIES: serine hydrolase [Clostridium]ADK14707.1 putative beta-lactamase [Clostridium ljungdahlii DSM 13528]OAA85944.1 Beta-lactamase precursor [Clostridium ljungdahlii DSM 13528]RMC99973.1 serine hydrolase [Clostridium autoethanogenum]
MLYEKILNAIDLKKLNCAFVIENLKTGEKIAYNENVVVSSASLIKIPIMMEILNQVKEGKLSLKQRITVEDDVKVPFSILNLLESGNSYTLKDVITLMIIQSDNTAANILMDLAGMDNVNNYIKDLEIKNTVLQRKMLDSKARKEGRENKTTAADMAKFFEIIYKGEKAKEFYSVIMKNILTSQLDNSVMRLNIPDDIRIAHKTGDLNGISHDAGIVYLPNVDYIFCGLTWDAVTNNFARETIGKISKIAYDYFISL